MSIRCSEIIDFMEEWAPPFLAEEWDNVGLLIGSGRQQINRILVCLDVTGLVVKEAVEKKIDLIVSHHPLIFKGVKRIHAEDPKGSIIYELIRNNISVYSAHTNLDVTDQGINDHLAALLGLENLQNLNPYKSEDLIKIVVFVPEGSVDSVRNAMCSAGAGWIGNYSDCTFATKGTGTFKPLEGTNPTIGTQGRLERVEEYRLETIVPKSRMDRVLAAMLKAHPYEEAAYDIYPLRLKGKEYGLGKVGTLQKPVSFKKFVHQVKKQLGSQTVRQIGKIPDIVQKVAVFCGSFDDNLGSILKHGADVLVTGDIKYHAAQDMVEAGMCVIDAGHFATERIMVPRVAQRISEKFPDVDVVTSEMEEDPIKTC